MRRKNKIAYRLFEKVQLYRSFAKKSTTELTISSFLVKWKVKKAKTYKLFKTQAMLLSVIRRKGQRRKGQPDPNLHAVQNPEHALVRNNQEGAARSWLTPCSTPRACSCQKQARRSSEMLTYTLCNTQSMLLSATCRQNKPDADLHPVQNPENALVSNEQEGAPRSWLTACLKPRAWSCQQWAGRSSQILTYILFKTQSMILSATQEGPAKCWLTNYSKPRAALVSNKEKGPARCWLTSCSKPEHALVSNKQEGPAKSWLTCCSRPRAPSCQKQAGRASQILTYILFKTQSILLSEKCRKGQPNADLHTVQNPEHPLVRKMQEGPAKCWLTHCSKPRACSCQQQAERSVQMLTYILFKTQSSSCQQQAERASQIVTYSLFKTQSILLSATSRKASQILTYSLFKTQSILLSATSRKGQPDPDLQPD